MNSVTRTYPHLEPLGMALNLNLLGVQNRRDTKYKFPRYIGQIDISRFRSLLELLTMSDPFLQFPRRTQEKYCNVCS